MAKLDLKSTPGFNAGQTAYAKLVRISEIKIDPEISKIFEIEARVLDEITQNIKQFGYDKNQPVVLWKDHNILVDGRTRLTAAKNAGHEEILATEKEFENYEDAVLYTFERQALRRNLSGSEILKAAQMVPDERNRRGEGRRAEILAQRLGVSPSTVYQALDVLENSSEEDLQAVKSGKMSLKRAYTKNHPQKADKPDTEFHTTDSYGLPENVKFLKAAVVLLVEAKQKPAAELLVNHYLKKHEKTGFYKLLPENIRETLAVLE